MFSLKHTYFFQTKITGLCRVIFFYSNFTLSWLQIELSLFKAENINPDKAPFRGYECTNKRFTSYSKTFKFLDAAADAYIFIQMFLKNKLSREKTQITDYIKSV